MTIEQFRLLDEMEKISVILQYGRLMNQSLENHQQIFCYRVGSFFVSAIYSSPEGELVEISCVMGAGEELDHFRKHLISIHPAEREYETPEV